MPSVHVSQAGVLGLIANSGPMAKLVLLLLLGASILCWAIILTKYRALRRAHRENEKFLNSFWNGRSIDEVLSKSDKFPHSPVAVVFRSGVKEFKKLQSGEATLAGGGAVDNVARALSRTAATQVASYEKHVSWLATTASAAPFVGLFGTVWGIMDSFQSIGATGAANLAIVAPGISEALITTATGIAAAIPAVVAYNHFAGQIRKIAIDMDGFSQDFLNIIQRSLLGSGVAKKGG